MVSHRPRTTLFRKYAAYFSGLVSAALLVSGLVGLSYEYRATRALVEQVQREKARVAALRIEQFAETIARQLEAALALRQGLLPADLQSLRFELHRVLQRTPAIVELAWLDAAGVQQVKVSRLALDQVGPAEDLSSHPGVLAALDGRTYFSAVYLRHDSEPHLSVAVGRGRRPAGILVGAVNLRFVWDVVSEIRDGAAGYAYVVDATGRLIAHPDIGQVLRRTDLSDLAPVRAALASSAGGVTRIAAQSADGRPGRRLTAGESVPLLGWHVFVEQPLDAAFAPLYASLTRTGVLLAAGIVLAAIAGVVLARRMTTPIEALQAGAVRLGQGHLDERVAVDTGDELELLADEFNRMTERLRESRAGLERKVDERTAQLAAANQAKSRFLAAASHDLRQPVHALGLYIAQLRGAGSAANRERLLARIEASSAAVSELIEALLDISKLDAGTVAAQPLEFAVQDLLNRLDDAFASAAQAKGLRLRVRPSPLRLATDPMLLERIVWNLVANALRYTRDGGVLVACRPRAAAARIEVWDTGVGIPSAQQPHVFEEFYQAHAPAGEGAKGLGLGLAIVDRLAGLLGLRVAMASLEGRGTVFAVEVPLASASGTAAAPLAATLPASSKGSLALVIDDDADARDAVAGLLAQWGWRTITSAGLADALAALGDPPPRLGLIIADARLRGGELGIRAIDRLRDLYRHPVPALLVSGDVTLDLRDDARLAGLDLLHKPVQAARLRTLLHHLVHRADEAA